MRRRYHAAQLRKRATGILDWVEHEKARCQERAERNGRHRENLERERDRLLVAWGREHEDLYVESAADDAVLDLEDSAAFLKSLDVEYGGQAARRRALTKLDAEEPVIPLRTLVI